MFKMLSKPSNLIKVMLIVGLIWLIAEIIQDTQATYVEPLDEDYEWEYAEEDPWDDEWEYAEEDPWEDDWEYDESDQLNDWEHDESDSPLPRTPPLIVVPEIPLEEECPFDPRDPTDPFHPENPNNDLWWDGPEGFGGPLWPSACFPPDMPSPAEIPPEGRWVYPPAGPDGRPDGEPVLILPIPGLPSPPCPYEPCRFDPDDPADPLHPDNPANDYSWFDSRFAFQWPLDCTPSTGIPTPECPFDPWNIADPLHPDNIANDLTWWGPEGRGTSSWVPGWPGACFPIDMPTPECPFDPFDPTDPSHPDNPVNDYTWEFGTFHPGCQIPGTPSLPWTPPMGPPEVPAPLPPTEPDETPGVLPPPGLPGLPGAPGVPVPPPDMGDSEDMIVLPGPGGDLEPPVGQLPPGEQVPPESQLPPEAGEGWGHRRRFRHWQPRRWRNGEGRRRHKLECPLEERMNGFLPQLGDQVDRLEHQQDWGRSRPGRWFIERRGGEGRRWRNHPGWNWDNPGNEDAPLQQEPHNIFRN